VLVIEEDIERLDVSQSPKSRQKSMPKIFSDNSVPQIPSDMKSKINSEKVLIVAASEEEEAKELALPGPH